jgi:hypothetical protein
MSLAISESTDADNGAGGHAAGVHPIPTSGPLPDHQTLEMRADLVGANQNNAWAGLHFLWVPQGQGHLFVKDEDEVGLVKFWDGANSFAWFFYEPRPLKNQNVTLVLALTRRGADVEITTRILDRDNANAVLFERTVTDTPQADPVLPNRAARGTLSGPDLPGTPWAIAKAPTDVELTLTWVNSQAAPPPPAEVIFDNLEVWQYESPQLAIQNAVVLSWPITEGQFVLESAPGVNGPWDPVTDAWWQTNAGQCQVTILAPASMTLFRLHYAGFPSYVPFDCAEGEIPEGVAMDQAGNVYIANTERSLVVRIPVLSSGGPGTIETVAQVPDPDPSFLAFGPPVPDGLALDVQGNIYVPVVNRHAVIRINADGKAWTTLATMADRLDAPASLAFGATLAERTSLFVTSLSMVPGFAGPSLIKLDAEIPGWPLP